MGFTVEQDCPQCGAPVDIDESVRLFECPFCEVRSYFFATDYFRFAMVHDHDNDDRDIIYVPYLRFKGTVYSCVGDHVDHKEVDITELCISQDGPRRSLGIKPQTIKAKFINPDTKGTFLVMDFKPKDIINERVLQISKMQGRGGFTPGRAINHYEKREWMKTGIGMITGVGGGNPLKGFKKDLRASKEELSRKMQQDPDHDKLYFQTIVGETLSLVYLPTFIEGQELIEATTDSYINSVSPSRFLQNATNEPGWKLDLLAVLCPQCGWDLQGSVNSVVLTCPNCDTAWEASNGKYVQIDAMTILGKHSKTAYLPFWRITVESEDFGLHSYADFATINRVLESDKHLMEGDMHFLVPAYKTSPKPFLNTAKRYTAFQHRYPSIVEGVHIERPYPVTLPLSEAIQSLKIIMAESCSLFVKKKLLSKLEDGKITIKNTGIIYLPFIDRGYELIPQYVQAQGIPKQSLEYEISITELTNEPEAEMNPVYSSCPLCGEQIDGSPTHCYYCGIKL